jgi:hypothetical protein
VDAPAISLSKPMVVLPFQPDPGRLKALPQRRDY